jgi:hypothetical protein
MEKKNWRVRYYNKKGNEISNHLIKDRTEHEAENEAMADMPRDCDDWSMMAVIEANLCHCNGCDETFIDQNSQVGAKVHEVNEGQYSDLSYESKESAWVCPVCKTDAFLMDM